MRTAQIGPDLRLSVQFLQQLLKNIKKNYHHCFVGLDGTEININTLFIKTLTFLRVKATMKRIPMAMKKATSQRRTKTTLIDVKPTWLPFFFDRELGMNSPRSIVTHVNYTFLSHLPNSNGEACSSLKEGAVGPQHNYSSFSFCQHSHYIWTSHDWVGRLFFKLILARSFNSPKHMIIFSVLYGKAIFNAWATCGILMCRLQAAEDMKPWPTPWPCLATSSPGRFSP